MTERLKAIWKHVDRIVDPDLADAIEASLLNDYLMETKFIIPEEDWYEMNGKMRLRTHLMKHKMKRVSWQCSSGVLKSELAVLKLRK